MSYPKTLDEYSEDDLVKELAMRRLNRDAGMCDYCTRTSDTPTCRFPERHQGDVGAHSLFLVDVSRMNLARAKRWHPGFPNDDVWTLADWSNAMCGEAGEAANVVKKLRRVETGHVGALDGAADVLRTKLGDEIADVYLYLDLLATKAGIDTQAAVVRKFNAVSEREGMPERLRAS
jgi:NTP pyrophosphatase (non-canonical NTP hydrolase)